MSAGDRAIRAATAAIVVGVAGVAAFISYRHAYALALDNGEDSANAAVLPLSVDGCIFAASMVLLDSARRRTRAPKLARWTLGLGIGASLGANVLEGLDHGWLGAVIAGWPAVALVLAYELLMGLIRRGRTPVASGPQVVATTGPGVSVWWPPFEPEPVPLALGAGPVATGALGGRDHPGPQANGHKPPEYDTADSDQDETDLRVVATARDHFAEMLANGDVPSVRRIRRELRVGHPRAAAVRQALESEVAAEKVPEPV